MKIVTHCISDPLDEAAARLPEWYCPRCEYYYQAAEKARLGVCPDCEDELQAAERDEEAREAYWETKIQERLCGDERARRLAAMDAEDE